MIRAMIFDLDGTLIRTEQLKAQSYAKAAVELCPRSITEAEVIEAYKEVVGLPRREVALKLIDRFDLRDQSERRKVRFGVNTAWQAFIQVRIGYYVDLIKDPAIIRASRWGHTLAVLDEARRNQCLAALATMSNCTQVGHILAMLNMTEHFDFIATRDDVNRAKPDPEIYELVTAEMNVNPRACLVIEDSPAGIQAALSAGMHCIAMTTPYTRDRVHAVKLLDPHWIVDDPDQLLTVVQELISERVII